MVLECLKSFYMKGRGVVMAGESVEVSAEAMKDPFVARHFEGGIANKEEVLDEKIQRKGGKGKVIDAAELPFMK